MKNGTIQNATFIESDPGHGKRKRGDGTIPVDPVFPVNETAETKQPETKRSENELKATKRAEKEQKKTRKEERKNAKTRRSRGGSWAVKNKKAPILD